MIFYGLVSKLSHRMYRIYVSLQVLCDTWFRHMEKPKFPISPCTVVDTVDVSFSFHEPLLVRV